MQANFCQTNSTVGQSTVGLNAMLINMALINLHLIEGHNQVHFAKCRYAECRYAGSRGAFFLKVQIWQNEWVNSERKYFSEQGPTPYHQKINVLNIFLLAIIDPAD